MASGQAIPEDYTPGEKSMSELIKMMQWYDEALHNAGKLEETLKELLDTSKHREEDYIAQLEIAGNREAVYLSNLREIQHQLAESSRQFEAALETGRRQRSTAHALGIVGAIILILGAIAAVTLAVVGSMFTFPPLELGLMIGGAAVAGALIIVGVGLGMRAIIVLSQNQNYAPAVVPDGHAAPVDNQRDGYQRLN